MAGHIEQRGPRTYRIRVQLPRDPKTGKRRRVSETVIGTEKAARLKLAELETRANHGQLANPSRLTVGQFLEQWLVKYVDTNLAPSAVKRYRDIVLKHLIPSLGHVRLSTLSAEHILNAQTAWLFSGRLHKSSRGPGLSPKTVINHRVVLHRALSHAVQWKLLTFNPADHVDLPRYERPEIPSLTHEQAHRYVEALADEPLGPLLYTALMLGMRAGELLGLRWSDVDLDRGMVSIVRQHDSVLGALRSTKTHRSKRPVPMGAALVLMLSQYRILQQRAREFAGPLWVETGLVFTGDVGEALTYPTLRYRHMKVLRTAGLPNFRPHDLRHTMASLALKLGTHPKIVSERLGHSSIQITLDTYSHVLPGLQDGLADSLAQLIGQPSLRP